MSKQLQGNIMLLLTAIIWGSAFVAQRTGMSYIGPFTFNGLRSLIGAFVLIPVILVFAKLNKKNDTNSDTEVTEEDKKEQTKALLVGGIACGIALFAASSLQQIGLVYTTAGKTGFITALYVVLVPIFGLFTKKKIRLLVWIGVGLALIGLYLLCVTEEFSISKGDFFVLLCAFGFAAHILIAGHFSPKTDGVKMSCIQFLVCGIISIPPMFLLENPMLSAILDCWIPICYAGVLSCGVAYTLQLVAQKHTEPTVASILLSLESVFAVVAGAIILHEQLQGREIIGCVLMFAAVIITQLPSKEERLEAKN